MLTYLALGDSYTIGESVPQKENFPHQTAALLRKGGLQISEPVIVAVTGWTTDELATAIRERGLQETFDLVTLLIGVNNQYRGRDLENYKEEFTSLLDTAIRYANGHPRRVFVLSIPDWGVTPFGHKSGRDCHQIGAQLDDYNAAAGDIADAYGCSFIDITDSTRANGCKKDFLAEDELHPSGKEYAVWAKRLAAAIENTLERESKD
jgi:lysophospholipase L1-like esterase